MSEENKQEEQAIRVIVAASSAEERAELCEQLRRPGGMLVEEAGSWRQLRDELEELRYDVVIVSGAVGDISAIEINQNIKTFCKDPPATVMLETSGSAHAVIKAFHCGFADYVPREPGRDIELRDAVLRASRIVSAERARTQRIRDLERLAQLDSTTGLPNDRYLRERLDQLVELGRRHGAVFGIILIRVNGLDRIRSGFGSTLGDAVLYAFAKRLHAISRRSAMHGRIADDCFLYLLEGDVTADSVAGACARLNEALAFPLEVENVRLSLSASIVASVYPEAGQTAGALLSAAEARLRTIPEVPEGADPGHDGMAPTAPPAAPRGAQPLAMLDAGKTAMGGVPLPPGTGVGIRVSERRNAVRRRCLKRGLLIFGNGYGTVNCLIRDLSETGARVEVEASFDPLEAFELRLVESGKQYKVEKRWQNGNRLGLRFLGRVK